MNLYICLDFGFPSTIMRVLLSSMDTNPASLTFSNSGHVPRYLPRV